MATVYYKSFEVVRIASGGETETPAPDTLNVYNVTAASSLGTVVIGSDGVVAEGSFTATAGDVIRFSHSTYPGTIQFTLTATQAEAYTHADNSTSLIFAVEDLQTDETASNVAFVYLIDDDQPNLAPQFIGRVTAGQVNYLPYKPPASGMPNARVILVSQSDALQLTTSNKYDAESMGVAIPGALSAAPRCLFDHFTDATTTGTSEETLYIDQIDAGQLSVNGDKITAEYSGVYAANANSKVIKLYVEGTNFFSVTSTENNKKWSIDLTLMRVNNTTLAYRVLFESSVAWEPVVGQITGLDLDANDYDLKLRALTATAAGDVTAKAPSWGEFIPAASTNTNWLLDEDGNPILDSDNDQIEEG